MKRTVAGLVFLVSGGAAWAVWDIPLVDGQRLPAPVVDAGFWWNPERPGVGIAIEHIDNQVFGAVYTYTESGDPTFMTFLGDLEYGAFDGWFLSDGPVLATLETQLQSSHGGPCPTCPTDPPVTIDDPLGDIHLEFHGTAEATLTWGGRTETFVRFRDRGVDARLSGEWEYAGVEYPGQFATRYGDDELDRIEGSVSISAVTFPWHVNSVPVTELIGPSDTVQGFSDIFSAVHDSLVSERQGFLISGMAGPPAQTGTDFWEWLFSGNLWLIPTEQGDFLAVAMRENRPTGRREIFFDTASFIGHAWFEGDTLVVGGGYPGATWSNNGYPLLGTEFRFHRVD